MSSINSAQIMKIGSAQYGVSLLAPEQCDEDKKYRDNLHNVTQQR